MKVDRLTGISVPSTSDKGISVVDIPSRLISGLVDIAIPVYNEQVILEQSVRTLLGYLSKDFPYAFRITIVDNASTDRTQAIGERLASEFAAVRYRRLDRKGKGLAIREAWMQSDAEVVAYMDVDLATGLDALLPLIAPLFSGHSQISIGSRLVKGATVERGPKREFISRVYNTMLRAVMAAQFSDAQCGFKAARTETVRALIPRVGDDGWFFDAELLLLAESSGLRIHEVAVDWVDDPDTRVNVISTAKNDLRGMASVARRSVQGEFHTHHTSVAQRSLMWQLTVFALVGLFSTVLYSVQFTLYRQAMDPLLANCIALFITGVVNTAANRRFTFGVRGPHRLRHQLEAGVAFCLALLFSSGTLLWIELWGGASPQFELIAIVLSGFLVTVFRFVLFREWVFNPRRVRRQK